MKQIVDNSEELEDITEGAGRGKHRFLMMGNQATPLSH